jgi:predicted metal-binding membrane protein
VALPQAVGRTGETRLRRLTALVGVGYFLVWTVFGMAAFPLGVALAAIEMQQPALGRAVPIAVGVVVLIPGSIQFTAWKAISPCLLPGGTGRGRTLLLRFPLSLPCRKPAGASGLGR